MKKLIVGVLITLSLAWGTTISTEQGDNSRNGANLGETVLIHSNVGQVHKLGSYSVDGAVWGQPLFVEGVSISGQVYNLLLTCTMHNSCYAFDGSHPSTKPIWHVGPLAPSRTSYPNITMTLYGAELGCLSTPVVDVPNGAMYVVCGNSTPAWVLYKLSLTTGTVLNSVTLGGSVLGTGDPSGGDCVSGGVLSFCPGFALVRAGLTLANGNIYVAAGSFADVSPFHGWLFSYSAGNLSPGAVFCSSPNSEGASFWLAGGAPVVDSVGNIYLTTGNGVYDGTKAWGESVLKFSPSLVLLDWFTPANWSSLTSADWDLSSGHIMLIPGTNLLVFGAKDFNIYSIDTTCMGHLQGSSTCAAPQIFKTNPTGTGQDFGIYGGMFANGIGYFPNVAAQIYSFSLTGVTWNTTPRPGSATAYGFPGAQMAYAGGIVWAMTTAGNSEQGPQAGTLRALNPIDLTEYWNSDQAVGDTLGTLSKFASPTIADGLVYAPTLGNQIQVYGVGNPNPVLIPQNVPVANKTSPSGTVFQLAAGDVAGAVAGTPLCVNGQGLATTVGCQTSGGGASIGPSAEAYQSAGQAVAADTATALTFSTTVWDTGAIHTVADRFTAPSVGYYLASCAILTTQQAANFDMVFRVNGSGPSPQGGNNATGIPGFQTFGYFDQILKLNANDYVQCMVFANGAITTVPAQTFMALTKLSGTF